MSERTLEEKEELLRGKLCDFRKVVVAFSGGVDSAVVAKAAFDVLGEQATAAIGDSPSLARSELDGAKELAALIGIKLEIIPVHEIELADYRRNDGKRCYHCKSTLYDELIRRLQNLGTSAVICNGSNKDDLGDYRPGLIAAEERGVQSPLAECGLSKAEVRELASRWRLPVWDKPASPCLASRVAYGEEVTPEKLAMIEAGEAWLRERGFREFRVRFHAGKLARIEVPLESLSHVVNESFRSALVSEFERIGFSFVSLDLSGFTSGGMNRLLQIESTRK